MNEKETKCYLKATEVLLDADAHDPEIDIYQGTGARNCILSDVRSEVQSYSEWDLNPRPLNSIQTLKPTELSGHYIYIYIYIYICIYR